LEACLQRAKQDDSIFLVESTTNQVDQYGGYSGMKPADFVRFVNAVAEKVGFNKKMIMLGGDHLGPYKWRKLTSGEAMIHSRILVEEYVKAGFQKIHLDASMYCADDQGDRRKPLSDEIVASRAVALCRVAENTWKKNSTNLPPPLYVIGSEVPLPGGAQEEENLIHPTNPEDLNRTLDITRQSFQSAGLSHAWERVIGVVVQPGVEYGDETVYQYNRERAKSLNNQIKRTDNLVFEAHSTDYQNEVSLKELVEDHYCILKVGPWLTFAYREALFALEAIEIELMQAGNKSLSNLRGVLDQVMVEEPAHWKDYYAGTAEQQSFKRKYSFSDRSRYYWPQVKLISARDLLFKNLRKHQIPLSLLSQYMPKEYDEVIRGTLVNDPGELTKHHIRAIAGIYSRACGLSGY